MDRLQQMNNSSDRTTPRVNKTERAGNTASPKATTYTENSKVVKEPEGTTTNSMSSIKVELQRTFVTPRGRKFPPREPKRFELSSTDNMGDTIREKIAESFPRLSDQYTLLVKGTDGEFILYKDDTDILNALNEEGQLKLFVQGQCQGRSKVVNEPVRCSSCQGDVSGFRTKCLQCPEYNLCTECDGNGVHGDHVMVRSDKPWFFKVGLVKFAEVIPSLCTKHTTQHSSSNCLPRLTPPDVRQFWQSQHMPQGQGQAVGGAVKQGRQQARGVAMRNMWHTFLATIAHEDETRGSDVKEETKHGKGNKKHDKKNIQQTECSACKVKIGGSRTRCLQCEEYNICDQCETRGVHADHVMVTCDRPRFFNFALPMFSEVIPSLCEKHMAENNNSDVIPRLSAKDVRQFWQRQRKQRGRAQPKMPNAEDTEQRGRLHHQMKDMELSCRGNRKRYLHSGAVHHVPVTDLEATQAEDLESKMETEQSPEEEQTRPWRQQKLQQMKRQWFQKCTQQWRKQLQSMCEAEPDTAAANDGQTPVMFWRPYMRQCWDQWHSDMADNDMTVDDLPGPRNVNQQSDMGPTEETPNPRRQWIKTCWKLWRYEANKFRRDHSEEEDKAVETPNERSEQAVKCHGPPFPGYGMMMNRSWRLMLDQMKSQIEQESRETQGKDPTSEEDGMKPEMYPTIEPRAAKQVLKRCWVNGCRQLWWMQVRNEMDESAERNTSTHGVAVDTKQEFSTTELMKPMSNQSKWKNYMQECWSLWKQLSKKSGLFQKQPTRAERPESDMEIEEVQSAPLVAEARPKQRWFNETWAIWKEEMSKQVPAIPADSKARDRQLRTNVQPFPGWQPLMVRSWKLMQDQLQAECIDEERNKDQKESMKSAWMREVDRKMKQLSMAEDIGSRAGPQSQNPPVDSRAGSQKTAGSLSDPDTAASSPVCPSERDQLVGELMEQYWTMLTSWQRGQRAGDKPRKCWSQEWRQWKKPRVGRQQIVQGESDGPRLRVTLSIRSTPAQDP